MELTPENAWREYWEHHRSFPECALLFGVSVGTLHRRFKQWNFPSRPPGPQKTVVGPGTVLTDEQVRDVIMTTDTVSNRNKAAELGVSFQRISQIRRGQHRPIEDDT